MAENPIFSYTKRDYEGSRQEGLAKIPILSQGQWTDMNATDPGIIILDYVHALVDMMNFYLDHQALESFITTAKERANVFRLAKQMSYKIRSAQGAECDVTFETENTFDYTLKIPKYTVVSTLSGIQYLTKDDAYLSPGEHTIVIACSQGSLATYKYQGTGISRYSQAVGAVNQSIRLIDDNIDIDTISILDDKGNIWDMIDHIAFASENSRVYETELNADNTITIKFGDGQRGAIPSTQDTLNISYVKTDAESGRVSENSIVSLVSSISDRAGKHVTFTVNNNNPSTGGSAPQSTQEIRDLAPGAIKTQDRAVTLSDFEYLAKSVDGVLDAKAYDINTAPDVCLYHEVKVVITPKEKQSDTSILNDRVYNFLYQKMIPPTNLQVMSPSYVALDVKVSIRRLNNTIDSNRLKYTTEQAISSIFDNNTGNIGGYFYTADLLTAMYRLEGVRSVVLDIFTTNSAGEKIKVPSDSEYKIEPLSGVTLGSLEINVVD